VVIALACATATIWQFTYSDNRQQGGVPPTGSGLHFGQGTMRCRHDEVLDKGGTSLGEPRRAKARVVEYIADGFKQMEEAEQTASADAASRAAEPQR